MTIAQESGTRRKPRGKTESTVGGGFSSLRRLDGFANEEGSFVVTVSEYVSTSSTGEASVLSYLYLDLYYLICI